ncbi:MAG: TolC family protein [Flavobacterium sp.]
MTTKTLYKIFLLLLIAFPMHSQNLLKLEDAVKIALENNYDIKIASNNYKIDETNATLGNAGMLPNINATIANTNNIQNISQIQADGTHRSLDNAKNMNLNYGVNLDWTIFDGLKMFARKDQLEILKKQGEAKLKATILAKIGDVYTTYYDLVQQQQQLAVIDTAITISQQRLTISKNRFTIGKASKLEVLNAQVDFNTDTSLKLRQLENYKNTKTRLNEILARDLSIDFVVIDTIAIDDRLQLQDLKSKAENQNPQLQAQILEKNSAELQLKQTKAVRYPTLKVNTGYNFSQTEASLGFVTSSSGKGLIYGFSAALPIFSGFNQNRNEKVAKIEVENANFVLQQQKLALESQLNTAFQSYSTNLELTHMEENNVTIAKQNLDITLAKYKIGTISPIDYRTAQFNYVQAQVRYTNSQFETKLYEIALKELSGSLDF